MRTFHNQAVGLTAVLFVYGCSAEPSADSSAGLESFNPVQESMIGLNSAGIPVVQNEALVLVSKGTTPDRVKELAASLDGELVGGSTHFRLYQLRFRSAEMAVKALASLKQARDIDRAMPNYLLIPSSAPDFADEPAYATSNPGAWWVDQIRLPPAWLVANGYDGSGKVVEVVDYGFYANHEELRDRIAINHSTSGGGHGTAVAGMVAASAGNHRGLFGTAPGAELTLVQIEHYPAGKLGEDYTDVSPFSGWAAAFFPLVTHTPKAFGYPSAVVSSFGPPTSAHTPDVLEDLRSTLGQFADEARINDIVIVHAAGNDPVPYCDMFGREQVVAVGGSDHNDQWWGESAYGEGVDLLAPAVDIFVPTGPGASEYNTWEMWDGTFVQSLGSGTSFAAPQVAGAIALLLQANSRLGPYEAADIVIATADPVSGKRMGKRLNVWKALLTAVNGEPFDYQIHDDYWYGVEIHGVHPNLAQVQVGDVKVGSPHKSEAQSGQTIARFNVRGNVLRQAQGELAVVNGFDSKGTRLLTRQNVQFDKAGQRWDDYVFTLAHTWHLVYVESERNGEHEVTCFRGINEEGSEEFATLTAYNETYRVIYKNENGDVIELDRATAEFDCENIGTILRAPHIVVKDNGSMYVAYTVVSPAQLEVWREDTQIRMVTRDSEGNWGNPVSIHTNLIQNPFDAFGFFVSGDE